jgi:hypothetical protein
MQIAVPQNGQQGYCGFHYYLLSLSATGAFYSATMRFTSARAARFWALRWAQLPSGYPAAIAAS